MNIYAEEMTDRVEIVEKVIDGQTFTGLRIYLYLPVTRMNPQTGVVEEIRGPFIHREMKAGMMQKEDDDSSAVTFWGKRDLRYTLIKALGMLDKHYEGRKNDNTDITTGFVG